MITLSTLFLTTHVMAKDINTVAGIYRGYWIWNNQWAPLILDKTNNYDWNYNIAAAMPERFDSLIDNTTSLSCTDTACFFAGMGYEHNESTDHLFIMRSQDKKKWSTVQIIKNVPNDLMPSHINAFKCNDNSCYLVGDSSDKNGYKPLFIRTNDNGTTWNYIDLMPYFPKKQDQDYDRTIRNIACHGNDCVAIAEWSNFDKNNRSFEILSSHDQGSNWQITPLEDTIANITDLIFKNNTFFMIATTANNKVYQPNIFTSEDNGKTWKTAAINSLKNDISYQLQRIDCNNTYCIAAGSVKRLEANQIFTLISNDNGNTWNLNQNAIPYESESLTINNVIVNQSKWILSGNATFANLDHHSFVLLSNDQGKTWNTINFASMSNREFELSNLKCVANYCVAIGIYDLSAGTQYSLPSIFESLDEGQNWNQSTIRNLPNKLFASRLSDMA